MNGPRRVIWFVALVIVAALLIFLFGGCSMFGKRPKISGNGFSVIGVPDAGKAATLDSGTSIASLPIPAGSTLVMTKVSPMEAIPASDKSPAVAAQPAKEVVEVKLSGPTEWRKTESSVKADTGTVDTSIAKHRIDVESSKILLYAAIGAMVVAGVFVYLKYPTPALMCAAAAVIFFLAWKLSDLPSWFYVIGVGGIVGAVALHRGYERRENEAKEHAEELAKAKALAVPAAPPVPVVVTNPTVPTT